MTGIDIRETHSDIKINVGCGLSPTSGWLNFDNSLSVRLARWPGVRVTLQTLGILPGQSSEFAKMVRDGNIRFADVAAGIPCADGSVAAVYSSHMIEHLDRAEARAFLAEVKRVLRPGGVVRIAAPDLFTLVSSYLETGDADGFVDGSHMGLDRPVGLVGWLRWVLVGPRHHLWMYDSASLSRLLQEAGFAEAAATPPGLTRITEPGQLNLWEREAESVYVEAVRPR